MNLNKAKELLENTGYIVENAISFKQEAENIVYSYGTDEYGLDVYQIVNIMEDASEIKGRYEQTDFITNQIKKITGLSIWDIENNENLQAAHFDICITVYKKTSQRKQNDNLDEAKKILKNAGYIIESSMSLKDKIANAEKQLTYIKLKDVADLLDSYKCSYTFNDNDEFYQLYLRTSFNSFKINYNDNLDCYDIYYMFEEGYESFKTAEELVNWIFEDGE